MVRAKRDLRPCNIDERVSYHKWVIERVQEIKLPFKRIFACPSTEKPPPDSEIEKVELFRAYMERVKQENISLTNDLENLQQEYTDMKQIRLESTGEYEEFLRKQKQDLAVAHTEPRFKALECGIFEPAERV